MPPTATMQLRPGVRLGPYEIVALLGAGGMGEVYRAHDPRLQRTVAIKVLSPGREGAEALQRFEQEARAASALNHPNILTVHDVGREGDLVYFAMEWVDGRTLRAIMDSERLTLRRVLEIGQQIAEGLAKAHDAGVVHRDLKPENVMVSVDGFAKVVDFGLAKLRRTDAADPSATRLPATSPGLVMGSAGYMSPEQASGREVDYRCDQFALGLLIYEMATGCRPFERPTVVQTIAATIDDDPKPIEELNPAVTPHLAAVVSRCLAKDPSGRYDSTRDLARDLRQVLETASRPHVPASGWPRRRGKVLGFAAALVAAALAAGLVAWRWSPSPAAPATEPQPPIVAVQAFRNLSSDPAQGYFAAGITEEIRGQLSKVGGLRLLSRSAVEAYANADVSKMAKELGVHSLVEGTIRVDGARVRIGATLIDAATQETLWADQYDRQLSDVFGVQSDVAIRIAQALHANLSPDERARLENRPTQSLEAYQLYLQARQMPGGNRENLLKVVGAFEKALALDPSFAKARAEMAYRLMFLGHGDRTLLPRALEEAREAVRTDPDLADAHFVLASLYAVQGSSAQARLSFLRALELNPSHTGSMNNLSVHEAMVGRLEESLYWARRSFVLSSKHPNDYYHLVVPLTALDPPLAREWLLEAERRTPPFARTQHTLGLLEVLLGQIVEGKARLEAAADKWPTSDEVRIARADAAYLTGDAAAEVLLERLMTTPDRFYAVPVTVRLRYAHLLDRQGQSGRAAPLLDAADKAVRARVEAGDESGQARIELAAVATMRNDHTQALQWLGRAYDAGYREHFFLEREPIFEPVRRSHGFQQIVTRMREDVAAQRARARDRGLLDFQSLWPKDS